jgi:hypothetical protein
MAFFWRIDRHARVIVRLLQTVRRACDVMPLLAERDGAIADAMRGPGRNDPVPAAAG